MKNYLSILFCSALFSMQQERLTLDDLLVSNSTVTVACLESEGLQCETVITNHCDKYLYACCEYAELAEFTHACKMIIALLWYMDRKELHQEADFPCLGAKIQSTCASHEGLNKKLRFLYNKFKAKLNRDVRYAACAHEIRAFMRATSSGGYIPGSVPLYVIPLSGMLATIIYFVSQRII